MIELSPDDREHEVSHLAVLVQEHQDIHADWAAAAATHGAAFLIPAAEEEALRLRVKANIDAIIKGLGEQGSGTLIHMAVEMAEVMLDEPHEEEVHRRISGSALRLLEAVTAAGPAAPRPQGQDLGPI